MALQRRRSAISMATISVSSHAAAAEMREWDAAPLRTGMPHGPAKAATYRQHGDDLGQLARRCRGDARMGCRALADGDAAWPCKGGNLPSAWRRSRSVRTPPPREGSCLRQRRASSAPCCPRGNTALARAKLCRRRAKISPVLLHLWKRRLFQNMQAPEGAPAAPLSLRKRCLLRSATDSGSRFFVRFLCGSGGHCATRASSAATSASLARMA